MRIVTTGGRTYADGGKVAQTLNPHLKEYGDRLLVAYGDADGADTLVKRWKITNRHRVIGVMFEAEWSKHGRGAGPIRNRRMIDTIEPHLVIAFPGGRGTADAVSYAEELGIKIERVER